MNHLDALPPQSAPQPEAAERMPFESAGFTDRVMTAIAVAPSPTPTRTFLAAIRAGAARDAGAALSVAWHVGTVRSWYIAPRVRTRSLALLLGVVTLLGMGSLAAAAAAVHVVSPRWIERVQTADPVAPAIEEQAPAVHLLTRDGEDPQWNDAAEGPAIVDPPDRIDHGGGSSTDVSDPPDKTDDGHDGEPPDEIDGGHDSTSGDSEPPDQTDDGHDSDPPDKTDDGHDGPSGDSGGSED